MALRVKAVLQTFRTWQRRRAAYKALEGERLIALARRVELRRVGQPGGGQLRLVLKLEERGCWLRRVVRCPLGAPAAALTVRSLSGCGLTEP